MPKALHKLVNKIKKSGKSGDSAWAIATSVMQKKKRGRK